MIACEQHVKSPNWTAKKINRVKTNKRGANDRASLMRGNYQIGEKRLSNL